MEQQTADPGTEVVLDNRKLILGFVLLVALCGACFVIGFMEGKRQAIQAKIDAITPGLPASPSGEAIAGSGKKVGEKSTEIASGKDKSVKGQLDWYENMRRGESAVGKTTIASKEATQPELVPPGKSPAAQPKEGGPVAATPAARTTYSVQVGAFRQSREAEAKASDVKAKGFECLIEAPKAPDQFYRVKVGRFVSRAEAVAMQHKLTKAGFSCIIKPN